MSYRSVAPGDATLRITAMATGTWSDNRLYESMLFGPDGDNWFHAELTADGYATSAASAEAVTAELDVPLPLAGSAPLDSVFTIGGTAIDAREERTDPNPVPHRLRLSGGSVADADAVGAWTIDFGFEPAQDFVHTIRTTGEATSLNIQLASGPLPTHVYIDQVDWQQPVRLDFGAQGAAFRGVSGRWRYRLANVARRCRAIRRDGSDESGHPGSHQRKRAHLRGWAGAPRLCAGRRRYGVCAAPAGPYAHRHYGYRPRRTSST